MFALPDGKHEKDNALVGTAVTDIGAQGPHRIDPVAMPTNYDRYNTITDRMKSEQPQDWMIFGTGFWDDVPPEPDVD